MYGSWKRTMQKTNRVIVKGNTRKEAEARVKANERRGYKALMDIKEEIDLGERPYYVCVMERQEKEAPSQ